VCFGLANEDAGEQSSARLQALKENSIKLLLPLLPERLMPTIISLCASKLVNSIGITPSTVCRYLT
jgi:hypothetical protein